MKKSIFAAAGALMLFAVSAQAQQPITATGTDLFAGPGEDYPPVVQLGDGYPLQVYGCVAGYTWCDVSYQDFRGWIDARDIEYPYQQEQVPAYLYGPEIGLPIISFTLGSYWGAHYHDRPFYGDRPRWENHAPPLNRWEGPRPDWNADRRAHYEHFEQERRTGGHDPRYDGRNNFSQQDQHREQDQQRHLQDQQHQLQDQQLRLQNQQRQEELHQRQDQQRQQQDQQRHQQDQQRQQESRQRQDQQRQQQDQQRQQQQHQQQDQQRQQQHQQQDQQRQQQQRLQQDQQRQQQAQQQQRQQQESQQHQQQAQQHQEQAQQHSQQRQPPREERHDDDHGHH